MKLNLKEEKGLFKTIAIEEEGEKVKKELEKIYSELQKHAHVDGFRPGKAPLWIVKIKYKNYVKESILESFLKDIIEETKNQLNLIPVSEIYYSLEEIDIDEKSSKLSLSVSLEVLPKVELKDISGIEIEIPKTEYSEEMLSKALEELREERATWEPTEDSSKEGDLINIHYEITDLSDNEKVENDSSGILGQNMFRKELDEALRDKKEGDIVELNDLPITNEKGEELTRVNMKVTVKAVKRKRLPELNDEFAKEIGKGDTLEELKNNLKEDIIKGIENYKFTLKQEGLIEKLLELYKDLEVPRSLVQKELDFILKAKIKEFQDYGIDTKLLNLEALAKNYLKTAEENVRARIILDEYAKSFNIEVKEEDIEDYLERLSKMYKKSKEELKRDLNEEFYEIMRKDIEREKATDKLLEMVSFKEVEKKEGEKNEDKQQNE